MATADSIIQEALDSLGHEAPTGASGTWTDRHALRALAVWPTVRDDVMARHPWSFAKARAMLATPDVTVPIYGYANRFPMPADCLRLLSVGDPVIEYEIDGRFILADATSIVIRYIKAITDPATWPAWFVELTIAALAARIAYRVTSSSSEADRRQTDYLERLHFATAVDNAEHDGETLGDFPLIAARFASY
jgi:hypothetical protein